MEGWDTPNMCKRDMPDKIEQFIQDYFRFKFTRSTDIATHIGDLQNIAFEVNQLKPEKIPDNDLMSKILSCLPEDYNFFKPAWDSTQKDEKTLDRLISRLIKAEDSLKSSKGGKDNVAFKAQGLIKKSEFVCHNCNYKEHFSRDCNKPKKKLFCNFCKKDNHTDDEVM